MQPPPQKRRSGQAAPAGRRPAGRRRLVAGGLSAAIHLSLLSALLWTRTPPPSPPGAAPITVALVDARTLFPAPTPPAPTPPGPRAAPAPARHAARRNLARPTPPRRAAEPIAAGPSRADEEGAELSEAQLAGATGAGSGAPGGACDMPARLQGALRRDPLVQAAVSSLAGKAVMVWNGDWVKRRGEDGKGLAAVREAIMWEIAFAPKACRAEPVHGLVVLSMNPAQGSARLAVGLDRWRWSDLLAPGGRTDGD
jgi:hypothetical protein